MNLIAEYGMTPLTLLHILGVAFGLGIATGMDFLLIRTIFKHKVLTHSLYQSIELLSRFVSIALVMLWLSGIGFLAYYNAFEPDKLSNPKIWSKLLIVLILSINGLVIHAYVLPKLKRSINQILVSSLPYNVLAIFFMSGAISCVSWYIPFLYGTLPQLNFAFSFTEFTAVYLLLVSLSVLGGLAILGYLYATKPLKRAQTTLRRINALTISANKQARELKSGLPCELRAVQKMRTL